MRDITLEDTVYFDFTTRAFATGIPTVLAGTPVLSVLEENNATPITAGVSVSVDRASVVGLNMATVVATAANGYENGKGYSVYISTGTVGGVSVIGEIVARFTIGASAAAVDLANGTDGLTALKTGIDAIPTTAMRGTDSAALASVATEARLAELDAANLPTDIAAIPTTAMRGTDSAALASALTTHDNKLGTINNLGAGATVGDNLGDMAGATFATATDSLEAIRNRGDAAWITGAGGTPPDLLQTTTIATLASQVSFTLTAGSPDNDSYIGAIAIITDAVTAEQKAVGVISDYVGGTLTVTLREDPGVFTMAIGDTIDIIATDLAGINIGLNGGNLSALNDLSVSETGDAVWDEVIEGSETGREYLRIILAVLANVSSGGATTTHTFRDRADSKDRVVGTVDANGNRTAITTFDGG